MITEINTQVNLGYKTTNLTIKQVGRVNLLLGKDAARLYHINNAIGDFAKDKHELSVVKISEDWLPYYEETMSRHIKSDKFKYVESAIESAYHGTILTCEPPSADDWNHSPHVTVTFASSTKRPVLLSISSLNRIAGIATLMIDGVDVICIDNIEKSLPKNRLKEIFEWIINTAIMLNIQVFMTTTDFDTIQAFRNASATVMDGNGTALIKFGDMGSDIFTGILFK